VGAFAILTLIWGTTWAAIRIGLGGIPPFTGVALRFTLASALLIAVAPLMGVRFGTHPLEPRLWIANAALSFCGSYGIVYWCEQWIPSGLAAILFATSPLFVAILAHFVLPKEPLKRSSLLGVLIGFAGITVIFLQDLALLGGPRVAFAALVMLAAPFVSALASVAIKRWGSGIHPVSLAAVPMGMAGGIMGALALLTERGRPVSFDAASVGALLYLALFGSAVTFSLYYWLLSHIPATRISLLAYLIPLVAVAVGAVFMREPVTVRTLAGSALVLAGVMVAGRGARSRPLPTDLA